MIKYVHKRVHILHFHRVYTHLRVRFMPYFCTHVQFAYVIISVYTDVLILIVLTRSILPSLGGWRCLWFAPLPCSRQEAQWGVLSRAVSAPKPVNHGVIFCPKPSREYLFPIRVLVDQPTSPAHQPTIFAGDDTKNVAKQPSLVVKKDHLENCHTTRTFNPTSLSGKW